MTALPYFIFPFAVSGDVDPIPTADPSTGEMSYEDGFTINYQYDLATNPAARPIPRGQFNQLMLDVTTAIQQYQKHGVPYWVSAAQNLGSSLPYDIYSMVRYNVGTPGSDGAGTLVYVNQVQGNTATPGADATWLPLNASLSMNLPFASSISFSTGVTTDITSLSLPIGKWKVSGNATFFTNTGPSTGVVAWLNTTTVTEPDPSKLSSMPGALSTFTAGTAVPDLIVTGPATVYLSGQAAFSGGTCVASGSIFAVPLLS